MNQSQPGDTRDRDSQHRATDGSRSRDNELPDSALRDSGLRDDAFQADDVRETEPPSPSGSDRVAIWRRIFTSPAVLALVAFLLIGVLLARWIVVIGGPEVFRERFGSVAPLITVPIHIIVTISPLPSDVMSMANGALYGFWFGTVLNWLGWFTASLLQFGLGRRARRDFDLETRLKQLPGWLRRFPVDHPAYLILSRQIPWLGGHVGTLIPGSMGVGATRFVWCSALAILPSSMLNAAIGAGLLNLASQFGISSVP